MSRTLILALVLCFGTAAAMPANAVKACWCGNR